MALAKSILGVGLKPKNGVAMFSSIRQLKLTAMNTEYSEQLQLLRSIGLLPQLAPTEKLHHSELPVGDLKQDDLAFFRKEILYAFFMHFGIFTAGAVARINGVLHHAEPVMQQVFPEAAVGLAVSAGFGGKIKVNEDPQDAVLV